MSANDATTRTCGAEWLSGAFGDKECIHRADRGPCTCGQPSNARAHGPLHRCARCGSEAGNDRVLPGRIIIPKVQLTDRQYRRFKRRFDLARQLPMRQLHEDGTSTRVGRRLPWWRYAWIRVRMWLA